MNEIHCIQAERGTKKKLKNQAKKHGGEIRLLIQRTEV